VRCLARSVCSQLKVKLIVLFLLLRTFAMDPQVPLQDLSSASTAAVALIAARVVSGTKRQYELKLETIATFLSDHYGRGLAADLELDVILNFFGWLTKVKHKDKPAAFSTVRQYKSALVWFYKEEKTVFPEYVNQGLETLLKGYKRTVTPTVCHYYFYVAMLLCSGECVALADVAHSVPLLSHC
jgi:hypothetical protein